MAVDKITLNALMLLGSLVGTSASASYVFQHDNYNSFSPRNSESSPGTYISSVSSNTQITGISVLNDLDSNGDLRFLIFDHATSALLYASDQKSFIDNGLSWKDSNAFSFVLLAGKSYDIGAIASVGGQWAYDCCYGTDTQNGITAYGTNANFANFSHPSTIGYAATIIPLRLSMVSPVPEPETYAMFLAGLGGIGFVSRRRKKEITILIR